MVIYVAFFNKDYRDKEYTLKEQYFKHFCKVFPDYQKQLSDIKKCVAYFVGKDNANEAAYVLDVSSWNDTAVDITFQFQTAKKLGISSGSVGRELRKMGADNGWLNENGVTPMVCLLTNENHERVGAVLQQKEKMNVMMQNKEYKGVCMMFAPLRDAKKNPSIWHDPDILYALGLACSKLGVTLLIKANETKKLEETRKYRAYCIAFLERGTEIEQDNARFATALAYRYYSNVHELMRPGERRDSDLEYEMEKANEWLSKALEMNPLSIRNNYRKGKLIIEKQAPYLLYGKKAFGQGEAKLLREIRQVGEEHLATAISLYEALDDDKAKADNLREYAKALFVLGKHYLNDMNLPIHEYFLRQIANKNVGVRIEKIFKLNLDSARDYLEKCFAAETDLGLRGGLDIEKLVECTKQWTRSPVEKLYLLGCVYSATAFIYLVEGKKDSVKKYGTYAITLLEGAKRVADSVKDRKRNTWHISERIAWTYIYLGKYERAARLLVRAKAGYIVNTYAIALLLTDSEENCNKAREALKTAVHNKHNLARGLSQVLYVYTLYQTGQTPQLSSKDLSEKNKKLAEILGVGAGRKNAPKHREQGVKRALK